MAFDKATRNKLQKFVAEARNVLIDEFTRQLQATYGLDPKTGSVADISSLAHLDNGLRETAQLLRETLAHYAAGQSDDTPSKRTKRSLERMVREQAFTVLNRLAALRTAEARGFLLESVAKGYRSKGFQLFRQLAGSALGETGDVYRHYLFSLFDELRADLAVLFDRNSTQSLLFPREAALSSLLDLLNAPNMEALWAEDETIGWIYQYYNDPDERRQMRKESAAPRNSRELAVRNQFFTPRYVVEFLTDNTLGRIWYEMNRGETRLASQCRYLFRRPGEILLAECEPVPETTKQEDLSQQELLQHPVCIRHRALKDPREIRLLDPACGSMHFGLYAFDLFETIYEEAWDSGFFPALQSAYVSKDEFLKDVPCLIIEHNIHGIDIDHRAVQIAGLSLWLRAQKAWQAQGVKPTERPRVRRSNIVCAEPMPGSPEMLKDFVALLDQPLLGELVKAVFDKMQLAGEAGSLLKIEEEIRADIETARIAWSRHGSSNGILFSAEELNRTLRPGAQQELTGIEKAATISHPSLNADFWDNAEQQVIDALRVYAEQADASSCQRRLFAADAARGFAFIDLCRKRYDAIVMNPPFGEFPPIVAEYAIRNIAGGQNDIYSAMILRLVGCLLHGFGRLGAITSRAFVVGRDLRDYRKFLTAEKSHRFSMFLDLGSGVLDGAMVETAAYIVSNDLSDDLLHFDGTALLEADRIKIVDLKCWRPIALAAFRATPESQLLFDLDPSSLKSLRDNEQFVPHFADVTQGLVTEDNARFLRLRWEVPETQRDVAWFIFAKGGEYSWFTSDLHLVVKRKDNGAELAAFAETQSGNVARTRQSSKFYGIAGATYSGRSQKGFSCRRLRSDACFSNKSGVIFPVGPEAEGWRRALPLLLASESYQRLIDAQSKFGSYEVGSIKNLPRPHHDLLQLHEVATDIYQRLDALEQITENAALFVAPGWVDGAFSTTWSNVIDLVSSALRSHKLFLRDQIAVHQRATAAALDSEHCGPSSTVSYALGASLGRWDIRYATGERQPPEWSGPFGPLPICPPGMLQSAVGLPAEQKDVPTDYPLRISWSGILVDDENHPEDIVARVREAIGVMSKNRADAIEQEICDTLGAKSIRDYFRRPGAFFADHLKRYSKSRRQAPLYWPISTQSGSYTLWLYYHRLTEQSLYACVNDFVEPKIKSVTADLAALRSQLMRSVKEEREFARLAALVGELNDFRDELLRVAKFWKPNLNDGVQITAAPLWSCFGLKPWKNALQDTWRKLERGDYDWTSLACSVWPERVLRKCHQNRSLAIAHGVEGEFWQETEVLVSRNKIVQGKSKLEFAPKPLSSSQLDELIHRLARDMEHRS